MVLSGPILKHFKVYLCEHLFEGIWVHGHFFFIVFTKGNNFYEFSFASSYGVVLPKWSLLVRESFCLYTGKFFPVRADPH